MNVHAIRLRGPWKYEWLSPDPPGAETGRVSLPADWRELFGTAAGRVRFTRTFHAPTNLKPSTRLDLVFKGLGGEAAIHLNGFQLETNTTENAIRCRISEPPLPTNELRVEIQFDPKETDEPGGLWGTVVLEIWE